MKTIKYDYTFDMYKFKVVNGEKEWIDEKTATVSASSYIEATFKVQKQYPSDRYKHLLLTTTNPVYPHTSIF